MTEIGGRSKADGASNKPVVDRIVIVGVGLMGGSLGMALIQQNAAQHVVGIDSPEVLGAALTAGAIHLAGAGLVQAVEDADLIVLATPIYTILDLLRQIAPHVSATATITDLASVKSSIVSVGESLLGERFVGGHPMAGSEYTGIRSARSSLFCGAAWALSPGKSAKSSNPHVELLCKMIQAVGATPLIIEPQDHDRAAALISHLPHLICFAYNQTVETSPEARRAVSLAAGSYRDLTRVVASDPILWRDVFIENRDSLLETLRLIKIRSRRLRTASETVIPNRCLSR